MKKFHVFWALLFYAALYVLFFSPVLFSNRILAPTDNFAQNLPWFFSPRALWNLYLFSGYPAVADPQSAMWYPLSFLFGARLGSFNLFIVSIFVLASWFTYGYVYTVTGSRVAGLFSGICYGMSGVFMAHLPHSNLLHTALWFPFILLCLEKLRVKPDAVWIGLLSLGVGFCALAGHPQIFLYTIVFVLCYIVFNAQYAGCGARRYYFVCLAGVCLGISMWALQLLPFYQLAALSKRAIFPFDKVVQFSLPFWQLPVFLFPYLFGGSEKSLYGLRYPGPIFEEKVVYMGLLSLLLVLIALFRAREKPLVRFWFGASLVIFLLLLRPSATLIYHVPLYNRFRSHARQAFELSFAIAVLAGMGIKTLKDWPLPKRLKVFWRSAFWLTALCLSLLLGAQFLLVMAPKLSTLSSFLHLVSGVEKTLSGLSFLPWRNPATGIPLVVLALGIFSLYAWCKRPAPLQASFLLLAIILDLSSFGWFCGWRFLSPSQNAFIMSSAMIPYQTRVDSSRQRLGPFEGKLENQGPAMPNLSSLWKLPNISGYSPLLLERYSDFLGMEEEGSMPPETLRYENASLDLLGLRYLFIPDWILKAHLTSDWAKIPVYLADTSRWRRVGDVSQSAVFENRRVRPRAWTVPKVIQLKPSEILRTIRTGRFPDGSVFHPEAVALVEEPLILPASREEIFSHSRVVINMITPTKVTLKVDGHSQAFLILSDIMYPGWRVRVDGAPSPIYTTDYVLRGVSVAAGQHEVQFEFVPFLFYVGLSITAFSSLLTLCLLLSRKGDCKPAA